MRVGVFLDDAHALPARVVSGVPAADVVEKAPVDLVDDLEMPRHEQLEQFDRPLFKRFRKQRVIGIRERTNGEVPGFVPAEVCLVEQDPHQLGDGERRVRVVELNGDMIGQLGPTDVAFAKARQDVLQRAADQEVFLQEPQAPARLGGIVWIQHARQRFGGDVADHGADEIAV